MKNPIDALVADMVSGLDADQREEFEERAGIIEFDGKVPRAHAECLALLNVLRRHPSVLTGVVVLQVELNGTTQWLLITDRNVARKHLAKVGGIEIGVGNLAAVVREQYGGVATLTTVTPKSETRLFEHLI